MSIRWQISPISKTLLLCVAALIVNCSPNHSTYETSPAQVDIATLKALCHTHSYQIEQPIYLSGVVMANDWLGEYYKSIVVADSTGGIELRIDHTSLYIHYPIYSHIEIACQGLWLGRFGGNIVLGGAPTGEYPIEALSFERAKSVIQTKCEKEDFMPPQMHFNEIGTEDIGRVAHFSRIRVVDQAECWCDSDDEGFVTTYRAVVSHDGHPLHIRTLGTAVYAARPMPEGEFDAMAVIGYADERYHIRIINYHVQ